MLRRSLRLRVSSRRVRKQVFNSSDFPPIDPLSVLSEISDLPLLVERCSALFTGKGLKIDEKTAKEVANCIFLVGKNDLLGLLQRVDNFPSEIVREEVSTKVANLIPAESRYELLLTLCQQFYREESIYSKTAQKLLQLPPQLPELASKLMEVSLVFDVAEYAIERFPYSPFALLCIDALGSIRSLISTRKLTIGDYWRLRKVDTERLLRLCLMQRENDDPEMLKTALKKGIDISDSIEKLIAANRQQAEIEGRIYALKEISLLADRAAGMLLEEFSFPKELLVGKEAEGAKFPRFDFIPALEMPQKDVINGWLSAILLGNSLGISPEDAMRRTFPITIAAALTNMPPDQNFEAIANEIIRISYPELLLFIWLSPLSQQEKVGLVEAWQQQHSTPLEATVLSQFQDFSTSLVVVFSRDSSDPPIRETAMRLANLSDFHTEIKLLQEVSEFLVSRKQKMMVITVDIAEKGKVSLQTAKSILENAPVEAIPMGKIIVLLVWTERNKGSLLDLNWAPPWKVAVFEDFLCEHAFSASCATLEDWLQLETCDFLSSPDSLQMRLWLLLDRYYTSDTEDFQTSPESLRPKIIKDEYIRYVLYQKIELGIMKSDWRRLVLTGEYCLERKTFAEGVNSAVDEAAFVALRPIVAAFERLSAFVSYFTPNVPSVWMEVWKHAAELIDFTEEFPIRPSSEPIQTPFLLFDYYKVIQPALQSENISAALSEFSSKSLIGSKFDPYPQLRDRFIRDLANVEIENSDYKSQGVSVLAGLCAKKTRVCEMLKTFGKYVKMVRTMCGKLEQGDPSGIRLAFFHALSREKQPVSKATYRRLLLSHYSELPKRSIRRLFALTDSRLLTFNCITSQVTSYQLTSQNSAKMQSCVIYPENELFFTGGKKNGWNFLSGQQVESACLFVKMDGEVKLAASMREPRYFHGIVRWRDVVFVFGGASTVFDLRSCEKYDLTTNAWTVQPAMHSSRSRFNPIAERDLIFLFGGFSKAIEYFNPQLEEFYPVPISLPEDRPTLTFEDDFGLIVIISTNTITKLQRTDTATFSLVTQYAHNRESVWSNCEPVRFLGQVFVYDAEETVARAISETAGEKVEAKVLRT